MKENIYSKLDSILNNFYSNRIFFFFCKRNKSFKIQTSFGIEISKKEKQLFRNKYVLFLNIIKKFIRKLN